jgi:GH35 family endo-1,4-beta-xylanase
MYLQKEISIKIRENFVVHILRLTDEKSRIRIRNPLAKGTDPGIRIRILIRTETSRVRNTVFLWGVLTDGSWRSWRVIPFKTFFLHNFMYRENVAELKMGLSSLPAPKNDYEIG